VISIGDEEEDEDDDDDEIPERKGWGALA